VSFSKLRLLQLDADTLTQLAVVTAPRHPENLHLSRVWLEEPFQNFDGRRLSGAVRAEQPEALAASDLERQTIDGNDVAIPLDQIGAIDAGHELDDSLIHFSKYKAQWRKPSAIAMMTGRSRGCIGVLCVWRRFALAFRMVRVKSDLH
jgi:hypothetical protein